MEGPSRNIIVNEDDTRKVEVYTQGDVDVTPTGIPIMASDAGGTIRILKQDEKGNLNVSVQGSSGTMGVRFSDEPYVVTEGKYGATKIATIHNTDGALKIYDIANGTVQVSGITNSIGVYLDTWRQTGAVRVGQVDGTVAVYFSQSNPKVNLGTDIINFGATASVASAGGSVSGSVNTAGGSGANTVKAPVAGRNIKVYAFSLTTTAQVHLSPRFTTGGSGGATELWRMALQAPAQGISGANLAVTPPGYLFSTGAGNTLAIFLDSASLVHYSVAYFLESA